MTPQVKKALEVIDRIIATGFLAAPEKDACEYCDCRPDPRLEGLAELRRTP